MRLFLIGVFILCVLPGAMVQADTVWLNDGTRREGVVVGQSADDLFLRVNSGGIEATINIPLKDVDKIDKAALTQKPAPAPTLVPAPAATRAASGPAAASLPSAALGAASKPAPASGVQLPPTRGFLRELGASALGHGPDDPQRLPEELRNLWSDALQRDAQGNAGQTLQTLRALDDAFSPLPGGIARLNGVCRKARGETFGLWLARIHWEVSSAKYIGGVLDLTDVRDSERGPLIGVLKEQTTKAIEPLRTYFPPPDEKTGRPGVFHPAQLQGITTANALEVKKQASLASAVLLAQMKLEPRMPAADRQLISAELQNVQRILGRADELAPLAGRSQGSRGQSGAGPQGGAGRLLPNP